MPFSDEEKKAIQVLKEGVGIGDYITIDWVETELAVHTVLNLIEKQDKIIDLMAKQIDEQNDILCDYDSSISYFPCNEEDAMNKCLKNECLQCIKEHFRKKVENE